ncbi:MAG: AAA family ATPase [Gammaproteobacteria bacterium]
MPTNSKTYRGVSGPSEGVRQPSVRAAQDQGEVIQFLSSPENHGGLPVQRIDTHISHIFLVGDRVYKLKQAVKFNFIDYSTLELREKACRKEVSINQSTAPDLYLGVVPVTRSLEDSFELGGEGKPVEWLVEMVRFDRDTQFDHLAENEALTNSLMTQLADNIAHSHMNASHSVDHGGYGRMKGLAENVVDTLSSLSDSPFDPISLTHWSTQILCAVESAHKLLEARKKHGSVRWCHGDLHLSNVCLFNEKPTPFDAIEFNDDLACIDVLYDFSFPLMDLIQFDCRLLANRFFNRYLEITRDYSGLELISLFLSLRAAIRAMALALGELDGQKVARCKKYFGLASSFLSGSHSPTLVAIGGPSGSGKSTLARALALDIAKGPGAVILHSDVIRKRISGVAPETRLGAEAYTKDIGEKVYRRLVRDAGRALRARQTVIADATFLQAEDRQTMIRLADQLRIPFYGLWLDAPVADMEVRLTKRRGDASDATVEVLSEQVKKDFGPIDWVRINSGMTFQQTQRAALSALKPHKE